MNTIKGIIFDLDGTLIGSVVDFPEMKRSMIEYIQSFEIPGTNYISKQTTNEIINDLNEKMVKNSYSLFERNKILDNISDILTEVEFENVDKVELLPGVHEFIMECQTAAIKMGILTRASTKYTIACLEGTGISKYFYSIVSRDDFTLLKAKPHLHALDHIIKTFELARENILFVGDHKIDYMCAQNGNISFVGVLSGAYNRTELRWLGCKTLVEDFYGLAEFVKQINNGK